MGRSLLRRASCSDVSGITPPGRVPSTPYPGDSLTVDSGIVFGDAQAAMRKIAARTVRRFILTSVCWVSGLLVAGYWVAGLLGCWGYWVTGCVSTLCNRRAHFASKRLAMRF